MQRNPARKFLDAFFGLLVMGALAVYGGVRRLSSHRHRRPLAELKVENLLVIKLCCLGDGVLAGPAVRALKQAYPQARVTLICTPRNVDAFLGQDFVDELVTLQLTGLGGLRELLRAGPRALRQALTAMRRCRPDLAVDLDLYYKITPILAFLSGAPVRAGFDTAGKHRGYLYTHRAPRDPDKHELLCFLDIVKALGIESNDLSLSLWRDAEAADRVAGLLAEAGLEPTARYAVLAPGSSKNWPVKRWAADNFAAVGKYLAERHDLPVMITGAAFEAQLGQQVAEAAGPRAVNLAGKTSIRETIELLREAAVVISNDSGPMHLAAAVATPVVGIFGPTNPNKWRPWSEQGRAVTSDGCPKAPCYYLSAMPRCDAGDCLGRISVSQVTAAVDELLP